MMLGPERLTYGTDIVTNELARTRFSISTEARKENDVMNFIILSIVGLHTDGVSSHSHTRYPSLRHLDAIWEAYSYQQQPKKSFSWARTVAG